VCADCQGDAGCKTELLKTGATETPMKKKKRPTPNADAENNRLLTETQIARKLGPGFSKNSIRRMRRERLIPVIRLGYRTLRFDLDAVVAALHRRTIRERH
jgi:hypothetical protein